MLKYQISNLHPAANRQRGDRQVKFVKQINASDTNLAFANCSEEQSNLRPLPCSEGGVPSTVLPRESSGSIWRAMEGLRRALESLWRALENFWIAPGSLWRALESIWKALECHWTAFESI